MTLTDEQAERLMPGALATQVMQEMETTKAKYLEQMAAAFLLEVGVPASEIELVQQDLPHPQIGWRLFYRVREHQT
jgi:hypothetical protein